MHQAQPKKPLEILFVGSYQLFRKLRSLDAEVDRNAAMVEALKGRSLETPIIWLQTCLSSGHCISSYEIQFQQNFGEAQDEALLRIAREKALEADVIFLLGDDLALNARNLAQVFFNHPMLAAPFKNKPVIFVADPQYQEQVGVLQQLEGFEKCELWDSGSRKLKQTFEQTCKDLSIKKIAQASATPPQSEAVRSLSRKSSSSCSPARTCRYVGVFGSIGSVAGGAVLTGLAIAGVLTFTPAVIAAIAGSVLLALLFLVINRLSARYEYRQRQAYKYIQA